MVPVFAGGLDFSLPVRKFFYDPLGSGKSFVDCVVSLTGFALVGGPARQDAPKVFRALLNLPMYPSTCVHYAGCVKALIRYACLSIPSCEVQRMVQSA